MHSHMTAWENNGLAIFIITFFNQQFIKYVPFVFIIVIIAAVIIVIVIIIAGYFLQRNKKIFEMIVIYCKAHFCIRKYKREVILLKNVSVQF